MEEKGSKKKMLEFIEKLTYRLSTFVFTNSTGLYNYIIENKYIAKNKIKVIGNGSSNGVDINYFSASEVSFDEQIKLKSTLGISENDFTFVFVGRIVTDKGINELVEAFDKISLQKSELKLIIVGDQEPELDPLHKSTLQILAKNTNIISVGFQKDIRPYLAISNVLVFPSYREGFPNVIMQAGSMGLPVIATDINGCNEIITHEKNGVLIPQKNSKAIEIALLKLFEDKTLYDFLKSNARTMIVSRFERKVICKTILEEYKCFEKSL